MHKQFFKKSPILIYLILSLLFLLLTGGCNSKSVKEYKGTVSMVMKLNTEGFSNPSQQLTTDTKEVFNLKINSSTQLNGLTRNDAGGIYWDLNKQYIVRGEVNKDTIVVSYIEQMK